MNMLVQRDSVMLLGMLLSSSCRAEQMGFSPSSPSASWLITSGSRFCALSQDGSCVSDGAGNYGNNERCSWRAQTNLLVTATSYSVETYFDYVKITQCSNICNVGQRWGNGVCEDGGVGGVAGSQCALGTDCADCGPRFGDPPSASPPLTSPVPSPPSPSRLRT